MIMTFLFIRNMNHKIRVLKIVKYIGYSGIPDNQNFLHI